MNRFKDFGKKMQKFNRKELTPIKMTVSLHTPTAENRFLRTEKSFIAGRIPKGADPKMTTVATGDGRMLDFEDQIQEDFEIEVGMYVKIDGRPAPDDKYLMFDASYLVVRGGEGKIVQIIPPEPED